jgi:hypothetical protein
MLHISLPSPKYQAFPSRQTCLIEAINDSIGDTLYDDAGFINCCNREWCGFAGGGLVDADGGWDDPDQHVDERVGQHLVCKLG